MGILGIILIVVFGLLALIIGGYVISIYNSLVRLKNNIEKAWSNIDVLLKQRVDELTKLMASVKGYMKHEKQVLTDVTKARTQFMNAGSVAEKAKADNFMSQTLKSLFAVSENYPDLKANQNFIQFQDRVSGIENQIADRREFYNDSVNTFNIRIEQIPYVFVANMLKYTKKELFKVAEKDREDVKVEF
ncbi:LemA family protein [Candidatus Woesearchaeota archaeon CG11_big_fil_rev_8_21_14_0_20_43_8]|nr:MAG: LemA family protein [Candidatus Woesearchaeota archaeon CG11_big_fil_rev_8_21_14_0_20_43_8]